MTTAIVVGSGPNGLAAAVALARAGVAVTVLEASETIGGGTRSGEMIVPGLLHDHCSAVHPLAAASPFLSTLNLERHGLRWLQPKIDCAHPLDDGSCGVAAHSMEHTVEALGPDGRRWRSRFGPFAARFADLLDGATRPVLGLPRHPLLLARFGAASVIPATVVARRFRTEAAGALWSGIAAHAMCRLDRPMTSAVGMMLATAIHGQGWVVAEGGSQSIANALVAELVAHGGSIETGREVRAASDLPRHDVLMLDVSPSIAARMLGDRLPGRVARAYRAFRHGPAAFKVDFAVEGDVPWTAEAPRRAGTVHLGGTAAEVAASELSVVRGTMPERPFVLVGQQYLVDRGRSAGSINPLWTYAHVPHGYTGDATEAIIAQIERFAPGFRDRVVGMAVRSATEMSRYNANYVGGDIAGGASSPWQMLFRPRLTAFPYDTGVPGAYLCSASTPPGAGAHGMCGANAAARALSALR